MSSRQVYKHILLNFFDGIIGGEPGTRALVLICLAPETYRQEIHDLKSDKSSWLIWIDMVIAKSTNATCGRLGSRCLPTLYLPLCMYIYLRSGAGFIDASTRLTLTYEMRKIFYFLFFMSWVVVNVCKIFYNNVENIFWNQGISLGFSNEYLLKDFQKRIINNEA